MMKIPKIKFNQYTAEVLLEIIDDEYCEYCECTPCDCDWGLH